MEPGLSLVFILGILALLFYLANRRPKRYPKGPLKTPLLGNIPQLLWARLVKKQQRHEVYQDYSKIYGPVFSINFGPIRSIVINDPAIIKEAWNNPALCGRPKLHGTAARTGGTLRGILFQDGVEWSEQRRFALRHLRDFGFGKRSMETLVNDEVVELVENLKTAAAEGRDGSVVISTQNRFNVAVLNSLWRIVTGERFSHDDKELEGIMDSINRSLVVPGFGFVFVYPWIKNWAPNLSGWNSYLKEMLAATHFVTKFVNHRLSSFKKTETAQDFTDVYIQEIQKTTDPNSSFYGKRGEATLSATLLDLFVAGAETTSTTLTYYFLYMALFPDKQNRVQEEIDAVLGQKSPALDDRIKMPFTEGSVLETLRFSSMVPLGLVHRAMEETTLGGYMIPKDTFLTANLFAVHHSQSIWGDPEVFRPERFLSPDGSSVQRNESLMAFSAGKRICLGEALARDELFLFVTRLLQVFHVSPDPAQSEELSTDQLSANIINPPKPHKLLFTIRSSKKNNYA